MQQLSKERNGRFTASSGWKLWPGVRGGMKTRSSYIFEKAEEIVTGRAKEFSNRHTDHGHFYEQEAIEMFAQISGLVIEPLSQQYFPINKDSGATPDACEKNFSDIITATADVKCPTETFFEQKMDFINEAKPEFQNCPKEFFIQGQIQMLAMTKYNESLGHPPVEKHYLVRYLTSEATDYYGNVIPYDLPLESRIFWAVITADKKWQNEFLEHVESASKERDLLVQIMRKPIICQEPTSR